VQEIIGARQTFFAVARFIRAPERQLSHFHAIMRDADQGAVRQRFRVSANDTVDHARNLLVIQALKPDANDGGFDGIRDRDELMESVIVRYARSALPAGTIPESRCPASSPCPRSLREWRPTRAAEGSPRTGEATPDPERS
jgi:hypothetical protein